MTNLNKRTLFLGLGGLCIILILALLLRSDKPVLESMMEDYREQYQALEQLSGNIIEYCEINGLKCQLSPSYNEELEALPITTGVLGVQPQKTAYIPGGQKIPNAIHGNTPQKRFENFSKYYGVNPGIFVEARNAHGIAEELTMCIAWAETTLGGANKSQNNLMNYGNNDRGDTRSYAGMRDNVIAATWGMSRGLLSNNDTLGQLSNHGREVLGLPPCETAGEYCYATSNSKGFWRNNVYDCLTFVHNEKKDWDNYRFKGDLLVKK